MGVIYTNDEHYKNIASKLRDKLNTKEQLYPKDMANKIDDVFEGGKGIGHDEGYTEGYHSGANKGFADGREIGYSEGKQAEYDAFWNVYQQNGNRVSYVYAFCGVGWNTEAFRPKYSMNVTNANYMFTNSPLKIDLVEYMTNRGLTIDFTNNAGLIYVFQNSDFKRIGAFGSKTAANFNYTFSGMEYLETIDELILGTSGTQTFANTFLNDTALKSIRVSGKIGTNFDIHYSPLDKPSLLSIADAVLDKKFTIKFNLDAVNKAFETSEGASDGSDSSEWNNLWVDKPNVTISLQNA